MSVKRVLRVDLESGTRQRHPTHEPPPATALPPPSPPPVAPVGYLYDSRTGTYYYPPDHTALPEHHRRASDETACWVVTVIAVLMIFGLAIIVASTSHDGGHPFHSGHYHPHGSYPGYPARQDDPSLRGKDHCATGETWHEKLEVCATTEWVPQSVDHDLIDRALNPCDNFEQYACGKWDADPAHLDETRGFTSIARMNERQVTDIVRDPSVKGVHDFYRSCVETVVEGKHVKLNAGERAREIAVILGEYTSPADLPEVFALLLRNAFTAPFALQIENHPTKNEAVPLLRFDGFPAGLERAEIVQIFKDAGDGADQANHKANTLIEMLPQMQANEPPDIDDYLEYLKSGQLSDDLVTWGEFKRTAFGGETFSWDRFLQRLDGHGLHWADDQEIWVIGRDYFKKQNLGRFHNRQWRIYIEFSITYHTANYFPKLPSTSYYRVHHPLRRDHHHARMHRFKSRKAMPRDGPNHADGKVTLPSEFDCVRATQYLLPGLVSKEFLKRNPEMVASFPMVEQMTERVRDAYAELIEETPGMTAETKRATVSKYRNIIVRVGHPTEWLKETLENFGERMRPDHFIHNLDIIREYRVERELALWREGGTLDRDAATRFGSPLSTVNAFYQPSSNTITILPGILKYPFYHPRMDPSSMYAGIGMVVGHELGHAADPNGIEFDEVGTMREWWTVEEKRALKTKYAKLIPEYNATAECPEAETYGTHTLGENVADYMGLTAARKAYLENAHHIRVEQTTAPTEDGTRRKDQLFSLAYAQSWCSSYSTEMMCARVAGDVHALSFDRVNIPMRNMPWFKYAWTCNDDDYMVNPDPFTLFG